MTSLQCSYESIAGAMTLANNEKKIQVNTMHRNNAFSKTHGGVQHSINLCYNEE